MHLDKQLGILPPTYEQSVAVFLLLHSSRVGPDLVCVWDAKLPEEPEYLFASKAAFEFCIRQFWLRGPFLDSPPSAGQTDMPEKTD